MGEHFKWNPSTDRLGQMLRQAVYLEDQVTLEHILKQRANLEAKDENGWTPLHVASMQCKPDIISWLVAHRADMTITDGSGYTPMSWACLKGHLPVIRALLDKKADITALAESNGGKAPLSMCAELGHMECVLELLRRGAPLEAPNRDGTTALMCAAHHCQTEVVLHLLEKNSMINTVDKLGWHALMYAMNAQAPPISGGGESSEQKVTIDGVMGKRTCCELLLLHGADVNHHSGDGLSALIIAAGRDRPQALKKLLEAKASVNVATLRGQTPLLMAAASGQTGMVRALIMAQAEVNHTNEKKDSALSLADKLGHKDVADLLKASGAKEDKKKGKKGKKK
mmetsp:Transcript_51963/g.137248  ORF Transcript_51963/g.137248 Transcript_51963/m.137248 type:complete len:340 (-) Transcript_51963:66-1085(-)